MIPIKSDYKTEKKYKLTIMLFVVLFFAIAIKCSGQIQRYNRYDNMPNVKTLSPDGFLWFSAKGKDTIHFSISMDSVAVDKTPTYFYAYYPKSYKQFTGPILVKFDGGSVNMIDADLIDSTDSEYNYVEYKIGYNNELSKLVITENINYIGFKHYGSFPMMDERRFYFRQFYHQVFVAKK